MQQIGMRELKQNPGPVLRAVQEDKTEVVVSVSRQPVARIVPLDEPTSWIGATASEAVYTAAPVDPQWAHELHESRDGEHLR